jgi:uncharacterized protein (TIGR03435 family)
VAPLPGAGLPGTPLPGPNLSGASASATAAKNARAAILRGDPEFTISTVRPSRPLQPGRGISSRPTQFQIINYTLRDYIEYAWMVHPRQIEGGPEWLDKDTYDLMGLLPTPRPKSDQMRKMTQKVVMRRFVLKFHTVRKEMPVYTLEVAQGGSKMKERKPEDAFNDASSLGLPFAPHIPAKNVSVARLAAMLQDRVLDRPVIDQTGLTGTYDFDLVWRADKSQLGGRGGAGTWHGSDKDPDLFAAMQAQLGLKLEAKTMPVDVLVIDSAIKPIN